jgi:hypothetical protein
VTLPDQVDVSGKSLTLNGMGVRTKLLFSVYVAGLYLEHPTKDAAAILNAKETRRVHMKMVRDVDHAKLGESIREGFKENNEANMPALAPRLARLMAGLPVVVKGDEIVITCIPGTGAQVSVKGKDAGTLEGDDFSAALLAVWLGSHPVDGGLKDGLLGR